MSPKHFSGPTPSMTFGYNFSSNTFNGTLWISPFFSTLKSNYQFIIMDLHVNSVLSKGIQCSSCLLNVNSRWVHNTPVFQACDILFHRHCPRDRYLQISFESQEAWTCLLVNRCPLANSNRSYRSCSRNCCPHTCYSTRMHIQREQSWLHPSTSSSRHHVIPTSRTWYHWKGALNDSTRI